MNNEIAARIFDELYDEDDLNELHKKKVIAQPIGFKLSTIAIIECELNAYHDRLTEENAKLREALEGLTESASVNEEQLNDLLMCGDYGESKELCDAKQLLNQLKDQNNDK